MANYTGQKIITMDTVGMVFNRPTKVLAVYLVPNAAADAAILNFFPLDAGNVVSDSEQTLIGTITLGTTLTADISLKGTPGTKFTFNSFGFYYNPTDLGGSLSLYTSPGGNAWADLPEDLEEVTAHIKGTSTHVHLQVENLSQLLSQAQAWLAVIPVVEGKLKESLLFPVMGKARNLSALWKGVYVFVRTFVSGGR